MYNSSYMHFEHMYEQGSYMCSKRTYDSSYVHFVHYFTYTNLKNKNIYKKHVYDCLYTRFRVEKGGYGIVNNFSMTGLGAAGSKTVLVV